MLTATLPAVTTRLATMITATQDDHVDGGHDCPGIGGHCKVVCDNHKSDIYDNDNTDYDDGGAAGYCNTGG